MTNNDKNERSSDLETGTDFQPRYNADGLVTAVVTQAGSGLVLMLAHMNEEAIRLTLSTGEAHFYSRSRDEIWHKGATSGNVLAVEEIRIDCDQDALWLIATPKGHGAACHTGRVSCFYRRVEEKNGLPVLKPDNEPRRFDPAEIYHK